MHVFISCLMQEPPLLFFTNVHFQLKIVDLVGNSGTKYGTCASNHSIYFIPSFINTKVR